MTRTPRLYSIFPWKLALFWAMLTPAAGRSDELVIGMSAAFTGPSRGLGIELYRGSMAYFEEVNQAGGIHGRKIVLKAYDDGYDPRRALANTTLLLDRDKVFLLYGYVGTPTVTRVLPLLKARHQPAPLMFFPFPGALAQRRPPYGDSVFNLRASYAEETAELVDNFVAVDRKKIAVFFQIDAYGRSGWGGRHERLPDETDSSPAAPCRAGEPAPRAGRRERVKSFLGGM